MPAIVLIIPNTALLFPIAVLWSAVMFMYGCSWLIRPVKIFG